MRRYAFYDQNIGVVLGDEGVLARRHARLAIARRTRSGRTCATLTPLPGDASSSTPTATPTTPSATSRFRPAPIWGHDALRDDDRDDRRPPAAGPRRGHAGAGRRPRGGRPRPARPDVRRTRRRSRSSRAVGRSSSATSDAATPTTTSSSSSRTPNVLFAGDLLENDATPSFGDGYPIDWPATAERLVELATGVVVPGHGSIGDRAFAVRQMTEFRAVAELARLVHDGRLDLDAAVAADALPGRRGRRAAHAGARPAARRARLRSSAGRSVADPDDPAAARRAREDRVERRLERVERDLRHALAERRSGAGPSRAGPRAPAARRSARPTESIPSSATPRRMNGRTVVTRLGPPALPDEATVRARAERPQHVRQRGPADGVDRRRPSARTRAAASSRR